MINGIEKAADPSRFKGIESRIRIEEGMEDALLGIEENEFLLVVLDLHSSRDPAELIHHTRMGELKGVFASRTPNRPSAIGVTTARLIKRDGNELVVEDLDAINGTPVLDIKPYTPWFDDHARKREIIENIDKRFPRSSIIEKIMSEDKEGLLYLAGSLHGHYCSGLALGIHLAYHAMREIRTFTDGIMEDLIAIVEMNNCAADGVQYVTGCTFGNNALVFRDFGKMALSLVRRCDEKGVRVSLKPGWQNMAGYSKEYVELSRKVIRERAGTEQEKERFKALAREESFRLVKVMTEDIIVSNRVDLRLPPRAPIHDSFTCAKCGENVMGSRKVNVNGDDVCIECAAIPYTQLTGQGFQLVNPLNNGIER